MAATNYTPIQLYNSGTTGNAPSAGNLAAGELAINYTDGKLFYKDNSSAVQVIAWKTTPTTAGGTGLTSYTAGDLLYYASGTTLSKLAIGSANYVLTSSGSAPQYVAQSTLSVGSATNATNVGTTDNTSSSSTYYPTLVSATSGNNPITTSSTKLSFVPSTGTLTATNHAGAWAGSTIGTGYGGTGLTSFTANGVLYASSTSVLATSSSLVWTGSNFGIGTSSPNRALEVYSSSATPLLRLNNTSGGGNNGIEIIYSSSYKSWLIGAGYNVSGALEFTRSTTNGGTTFTTPDVVIDTGQLKNTCPDNTKVSLSTIHSGSAPQGIQVTFSTASPNNSGTADTFLYCVDSSAVRLYISGNGGVNNYSANNTNLSDATLKKDITPAKSYLSILNQIPVVTFLFNDQTDSELNLGVTAQSVQAVAPELVGNIDIGTKENPNIKLAIYETDLKYAMLKAIQELSAQVTTMQAQIVAFTPKS